MTQADTFPDYMRGVEEDTDPNIDPYVRVAARFFGRTPSSHEEAAQWMLKRREELIQKRYNRDLATDRKARGVYETYLELTDADSETGSNYPFIFTEWAKKNFLKTFDLLNAYNFQVLKYPEDKNEDEIPKKIRLDCLTWHTSLANWIYTECRAEIEDKTMEDVYKAFRLIQKSRIPIENMSKDQKKALMNITRCMIHEAFEKNRLKLDDNQLAEILKLVDPGAIAVGMTYPNQVKRVFAA